MRVTRKRDIGLEVDGVWLTYVDPDTLETLECRIASSTHRSFNRARTKVAQGPGEPEDKALRLYAEHVLLDWRGATDEDGEQFPPTLKNKLTLLECNPEFQEWLVRESARAANFQKIEPEVAAKEQEDLKSRAPVAVEPRQA